MSPTAVSRSRPNKNPRPVRVTTTRGIPGAKRRGIAPNPCLIQTRIPNSTPGMVTFYALSEQDALLAKIRHNRLLDIFLGITTHSLNSHLRTTVKGIGQVEIDEIYVGVDRHGRQFVLPVQAKSGKDQLSAVQTKQDVACCRAKFPHLICRPISAQFAESDLIALFELEIQNDDVRVLEEKHYRLVPSDEITAGDLETYSMRG